MTASLYEGQVNALQKRRETPWPNDERHLPVERRGEGSYGVTHAVRLQVQEQGWATCAGTEKA